MCSLWIYSKRQRKTYSPTCTEKNAQKKIRHENETIEEGRMKNQNERRQKQTALKTTNHVSVNVISESLNLDNKRVTNENCQPGNESINNSQAKESIDDLRKECIDKIILRHCTIKTMLNS